jgi:RNA polymerase-binding transcription factor DksA
MATKKKAAAKPAKKSVPVKKAAPAKKPVAKKAAPAKKAAKPAPKPVAKKAAPAKPAPKATVAKPVKKPEPMKLPPIEKKPEVKGVVTGKPIKLVSAPPPPVKKKTEPAKPTKVVLPEIKTKTARKYEPEFTKSVLDQPENIQTGPSMRYSDADLQEFRELIQKKLDQAKKELAYLQGLITRKDEMGGDETENRYMTMEDGSMSMEREQLAQMASRQINYIDHLEKALMRIENKTYGICRVTGKLIDKARLRAVPHATLSIEAKQMMNK